MSNSAPTIVLVHGAFAESASWNPVIERLRDHGPAGSTHDAPAIGDVIAVANPLRSLVADAAYVSDVIRAVDGPVVLVGHSYGGMVSTEAAAGNQAVIALVYVAAFAPDTGESALALSARFPGSTLADALSTYPVSMGGDELVIKPELFRQQFAADLPVLEAELMATTQRPVTMAALSDVLVTERPAWKDIPSWFVFGDRDLNIPPQLHRFVAERAGSHGTTEVTGASHAVSVSTPDAVTSTILDAASSGVLSGGGR